MRTRKIGGEMSDHVVGNCYGLLGHVLELIKISKDFPERNRCKLSCRIPSVKCCSRNSGIEMTCHITDLDALELVKGATIALSIDPKEWQQGDIAEVAEGWERAGERFDVLGPAVFQKQWWVPVNDPDDEEPTYHKAGSLKRVIK